MECATDEYLMMRFRNLSDLGSFEEITERYSGKALGVARHYLFDDGAAEDAVQETFLKVVRYAGRYTPTSPFAPWFFRMLRNVCLDMLRKKKVHRDYVERFGADAAYVGEEDPTSLDQDAARLLAQLPVEEREVLVMKIINDMPFAEIALAVDSSVEAVKKRSQRGLKRLREMYERRYKTEIERVSGQE